MNIELKKAEDAFKQGHTFFLTGKAGTGKSFFLKSILKDTIKKCIVLAPTGMAALNVNGQTIHSFFKFPISPLLDPVLDACQFEEKGDKYQLIIEVDCIIIDEISMVRADLLDTIDHSLKINGGNENLPFGGKQMIFIGDLMQLPPIITKTVQKHYFQGYDSLYFLSAEVFKTFPLYSIELKHVYRQQTNSNFLQFLNEIRDQSISQTMLDYINRRVGLQPDKDVYAIRLMTRNRLADEYNKKKLDELDGQLWLFKPEIEGDVSPEQRKNFKEALALKIDAQVSFNKNDMHGRYFNGSIGKLTQITDDELTIVLENGTEIQTGKYKYELVDYGYDTAKKRVTKKTIGTITQFPIQLAWAITIHKSQGQTYENAVIDMGNGAFTVGQTYVAFSRVKSYDGLYLTMKLYQSDIIKDAGLMQAVKNIINLDKDETVKMARRLINLNTETNRISFDQKLFGSDFISKLDDYYDGDGEVPEINSLITEINEKILPIFLSGKLGTNYSYDDLRETINNPENSKVINNIVEDAIIMASSVNLKARPPFAKFDTTALLLADIDKKETGNVSSVVEKNDEPVKMGRCLTKIDNDDKRSILDRLLRSSDFADALEDYYKGDRAIVR